MRIDFHSKGIEVAEQLRTHVVRRLGYALGRFQPLIRRVRVELTQSDDTEGSAGNRCCIRVDLNPSGDVEIEESDVNLFTLTDRAAGRIGLAVYSELYRLHKRNRHSRSD